MDKDKVGLAYVDSELKQRTGTEGNNFFNEGKSPESIKKFDEGMKRTLEDDKV